jgi:hypothetical protein
LDASTQAALTEAAQSGKLASLPVDAQKAVVQAIKAGDSDTVNGILAPAHSAVDKLTQAIQDKVTAMASYAKAHGIDPASITDAEARNAFAKSAHSHGTANGLTVPKQGYRGVSDAGSHHP